MTGPDDGPSSSSPAPLPQGAAGGGVGSGAEPILRYDRLGGGVKDLLAETSATALALSSKLIAIGTSDGSVSVHDYEGNQIKHYPLHSGPVRSLSFDASAEYLASCCTSDAPPATTSAASSTTATAAANHYAAITSLYTDETTKLAFKRPLRCVALDPLYASRKSREVVTADARGRLKLTSAGGWLGRSDRALPCETPVSALQWVGSTLAWASDGGVRVYDTRAGQVLGSVARPRTTAAAAAVRTTVAARRPGAAPSSSTLPTPASSVAPSAPGSPRPGMAGSCSANTTTTAATAAAAAAALADGSQPLPHAHVRACRLYLSEDERTLYIAWPDAIRVVSISSAGGAGGASADAAAATATLPRRSVSVVASFPTTGFYCLGAAPHGKDKLAVLALPEVAGDSGVDDDDEEEEEEQEEATTAAGDDEKRQRQPPRTTQPKPFGPKTHRSHLSSAAAPALVRSPGGSGSGYLERYIKARGTGSDALAAAAAALQSSVASGVGGAGGKSRLASIAASEAAGEEVKEAEEEAAAGPSSASDEPSNKPPKPQQRQQQQQPSTSARRPELRILALDGGAQYASDALAVRGYAACGPADYALAPSYGNELALAGALAAAAAAAAATAEAFSSSSAAAGGGGSGGGGGGGSHHAAAGATSTTTAQNPETTSTTAAATAATLARLARLQEESGAGAGGTEFMYFILSPQDIVYGRFRDAEDRVAWLMERRRFEDALALAAAAGPGAVPPAVRDAAAAAFLEDLTATRGAWERAAAALPALLGDRPQLWERWLHTFAAARKLRALAPRVPTRAPPGPVLSRAAYETVLNALLADPEDHPTLLGLVQAWPNALYRPAVLTDAVAARLRRAAEAAAEAAQGTGATGAPSSSSAAAAAEAAGGTRSLWQTLALLYKAQGRPDLSLAIYLQLRLPSVFEFLQQQPQPGVAGVGAGAGGAGGANAASSSSSSSGLLPFLDGPKAAALFEIDERKATDLLVRNMDAVPPAAVVPALLEAAAEAEREGGAAPATAPTQPKPTSPRSWRRRAHEYLHRVFLADPSAAADHADLQLDLIAEFSPKDKLMPFLQASQSCPLEKALSVCRRQNLVDEQVFLLSRMGNPRAALEIIVERQRDVPRAIEFVRSQEQQQRLAAEAAALAARGDDASAATAPPPQQPDDTTAQLWDQLIAWAIAAGGDTTGALLDNLGGSLDPLVVVERIPGDLKVPSLRDRLSRAVADHRSGAGLLEGCATILRADAARLVARLGREARRAARDVYVVVEAGGGGVGGLGSGGAGAGPGGSGKQREQSAAAPAAPTAPNPPLLLLKYDAAGMPAGACAPEDLPRGAYEALLLDSRAKGARASSSAAPPGQVTSTSPSARARFAARGALWVGLTAAAREEDERERRRQRPGATGGSGAGSAASLVATM